MGPGTFCNKSMLAQTASQKDVPSNLRFLNIKSAHTGHVGGFWPQMLCFTIQTRYVFVPSGWWWLHKGEPSLLHFLLTLVSRNPGFSYGKLRFSPGLAVFSLFLCST